MGEIKHNKNLKVLHISPLSLWDLGIGKGRISTFYPLRKFVERGHSVLFLTSNSNIKSGIYEGIRVLRMINVIPIRRRYLDTITTYLSLPLFIFFSLIQGLIIGIKFKPNVIYAHVDYCAFPAFIISKVLKARCVLRLYGFSNSKFSFLYRLTQTIAFRLPLDLYIIVNDGTLGDKIIEKYRIASEKVLFWVNGVNKNWSERPLNLYLREKIAPNNEKIVLSVSRLVGWKQVDVLIKAIPNVIKEYRNVRFIIVGDGDQRRKLEDLVKDLNVSNFVNFVGSVSHEEVIDFMNISDIFVSMNALSSINNPVLEAMSCGKAVISLNTGASEDLIKNFENGILLEVEEKDKLADYLLLLLKNDDLRSKLGSNAKNFILSKWPTWEERTEFEVRIIETLCFDDFYKFKEIKEKADTVLDLRIFNKSKDRSNA